MPTPRRNRSSSGGRSLPQAVGTALVLVGLMVGSYFLGPAWFFVLVAAVVLIALFEMLDAVVQSGGRPVVAWGLAGGAAMLLTAFFAGAQPLGLVIGATAVGAFVLALRPGRGPRASSDVAWTVLGVVWVAGGGAAATLILGLDPGGLALLIAFILITALDDIGAYFSGTAFGKHKMAPGISPAKSWEGLAGGAAVALAGGAFFGVLLDEISVVDGLGLAAICAALAPVGDLAESMFKRETGIKDSGRLLPGHGGLLDRIDAILFCAPAVYLYLRFIALP